MPNIRRATAADAELLAEQRLQMYMDAEVPWISATEEMRKNFGPWVCARIEDGSYIGWIVEEDGRAVGGAGLWVMDWPPHFLDAKPGRGYLLNFYVAPEVRRQGLASELLELSVAEARARGLGVVTLHASKYGRPVYEKFGFKSGDEMLIELDS
jgi:GNAT superfamily N-acetyltransferase